MKRMRAYRLARVQAELRKHDYAGGFFCDPFNVRYATGTRNMAVWTSHVPARYCFVPARRQDDPVRVPQQPAPGGRHRDGRRVPPLHRLVLHDDGRAAGREGEGVRQDRRRRGRRSWRRRWEKSPRCVRPPGSARPRSRARRRHRGVRRRGGDAARALGQVAGRDRGDDARARRMRRRHRADARSAAAGDDRERAVGALARDEHPPRRRMHRDAALRVGRPHESVVPGMQRPGDSSRRSRGVRHRHDRADGILLRHFAHVPHGSGQGDAPSSGSCTRSPSSRSTTTSDC